MSFHVIILCLHVSTFEGSYYDLDEAITNNIASCLEARVQGENTLYEAKNTQGKIVLDLCDKKKNTAFFQLTSPLQVKLRRQNK